MKLRISLTPAVCEYCGAMPATRTAVSPRRAPSRSGTAGQCQRRRTFRSSCRRPLRAYLPQFLTQKIKSRLSHPAAPGPRRRAAAPEGCVGADHLGNAGARGKSSVSKKRSSRYRPPAAHNGDSPRASDIGPPCSCLLLPLGHHHQCLSRGS